MVMNTATTIDEHGMTCLCQSIPLPLLRFNSLPGHAPTKTWTNPLRPHFSTIYLTVSIASFSSVASSHVGSLWSLFSKMACALASRVAFDLWRCFCRWQLFFFQILCIFCAGSFLFSILSVSFVVSVVGSFYFWIPRGSKVSRLLGADYSSMLFCFFGAMFFHPSGQSSCSRKIANNWRFSDRFNLSQFTLQCHAHLFRLRLEII